MPYDMRESSNRLDHQHYKYKADVCIMNDMNTITGGEERGRERDRGERVNEREALL